MIQIKVSATWLAYFVAHQPAESGSRDSGQLSMRTHVWHIDQAAFEASHARLLELCLELEEFADALPNRLEPGRCRRLAEALLPLLRQCHAMEEGAIGAIDASRIGSLQTSVVRLRSEHRRDQYFAEDIADALGQVSDTKPLANPEAMGFMMRSFFEMQRRHIAFEQEHILPLLVKKS